MCPLVSSLGRGLLTGGAGWMLALAGGRRQPAILKQLDSQFLTYPCTPRSWQHWYLP